MSANKLTVITDDTLAYLFRLADAGDAETERAICNLLMHLKLAEVKQIFSQEEKGSVRYLFATSQSDLRDLVAVCDEDGDDGA
jgi:hypothetical protein